MRLSASKISLYAECPLKYKFKYIDKIEKPQETIHLDLGIAVHAALELFNKELCPVEDVLQEFHNSFECQKDHYLHYKLYWMGINGLIKYLENVDYTPLETEKRFETTIEGIEVVGIIDAVLKRKGKIHVVDYKTSKNAYTRFQLDTSFQLALYFYAAKEMGINPEYIAYWIFLKDYDTLNGDIKLQRKKITTTQIERMKSILRITKQGIENQIFVPYVHDNCKWCEYKQECLEWPKKGGSDGPSR